MQVEEVFGDLPDLETERLVLRKLTLEDAQDMFEILSDPQVTRFTPREPQRSLAESQRFVEGTIERYRRGQVSRWGIVPKGDGKLIGVCGFIDWSQRDARAEIAYLMARQYWGRGYMTEAVRRVTRFGFCTMGLNRIEAPSEPANVASIRVLEKAGMRFEALLRDYHFDKGAFHTVGTYAILRSEWMENL